MQTEDKPLNRIVKRAVAVALGGFCLVSQGAFADEAVVKVLPETGHALAEYVQQKDVIYLADRSELADALAGGVLSGERGAYLMTIDSQSPSEEDLAVIASAEEIVLLGGPTRIPTSFEQLPNYKARHSGADRYETAVVVAKELGSERNIAIVNGDNYVDAIMATPFSVLEDRNILMVSSSGLPQITKDYLSEFGAGKNVVFVGGEASISRALKEEIYHLTGGDISQIDENTIAGEDRYFTGLETAKRTNFTENLVLVSGDDYERAILSVNLVDSLNTTTLLVTQENAKQIVEEYSSQKSPTDIYSMGINVSLSSFEGEIVEEERGNGRGQNSHRNDEKDPATQAPVEDTDSQPNTIEQPAEEPISTPEPTPAEEPAAAEVVPEPEISVADRFVAAALEMEGFMYSQSMRMADGYADCSSLVLRALINSGLTSDTKTNLTSETIWGDSRFVQISADELQRGDICYSYGHLAIYMGDGKVFEAKDWGIPAGYGNFAGRFSAFFRVSGI